MSRRTFSFDCCITFIFVLLKKWHREPQASIQRPTELLGECQTLPKMLQLAKTPQCQWPILKVLYIHFGFSMSLNFLIFGFSDSCFLTVQCVCAQRGRPRGLPSPGLSPALSLRPTGAPWAPPLRGLHVHGSFSKKKWWRRLSLPMALNLRTEFYPIKTKTKMKKNRNDENKNKKRTSCYSGATYW